MFMIAMAIALVGYVVFPTAPPRFLPEWGFIDTVAQTHGRAPHHTSASMTALFNPYAAVPSMHVAVRADDRLVARAPGASAASCASLWAIYPFLITFVIIVTANHFIIDALLGALTAGVVRLRRDAGSRVPGRSAWRFSDVPDATRSAHAGLTASG